MCLSVIFNLSQNSLNSFINQFQIVRPIHIFSQFYFSLARGPTKFPCQRFTQQGRQGPGGIRSGGQIHLQPGTQLDKWGFKPDLDGKFTFIQKIYFYSKDSLNGSVIINSLSFVIELMNESEIRPCLC